MCEANVYREKEGREELLMESVHILKPEGEKILLQNIFGEQRLVKGRLKLLDFTQDKIVIEER